MDLKVRQILLPKYVFPTGEESYFSDYVLTVNEFNEPVIATFNYKFHRWETSDGERIDDEIDFKWCSRPDWLNYD